MIRKETTLRKKHWTKYINIFKIVYIHTYPYLQHTWTHNLHWTIYKFEIYTTKKYTTKTNIQIKFRNNKRKYYNYYYPLTPNPNSQNIFNGHVKCADMTTCLRWCLHCSALALVHSSKLCDFVASLITITATPLSTPASSPCGTKYLSYSNIFFANFKEEQERILAENLKHQPLATRIRTNTRLCRETAINNNNECTPSETVFSSDQESVVENGNETANNISPSSSSSYDTNNPDLLDSLNGEEEECSLNKHSIKGALYNAAAAASPTNVQTGQSKKIRITENPLPETVSC